MTSNRQVTGRRFSPVVFVPGHYCSPQYEANSNGEIYFWWQIRDWNPDPADNDSALETYLYGSENPL